MSSAKSSEFSSAEERSEEERLQALFAEAGRRAEPAQAKKQEWETLFRRELGAVITAKRQQRRTLFGGVAAAMVVVAGVFALLSLPVQQPILVAEVVSAINGNQTFSDGSKAAPLTEGSNVHVGQTVRTAAQGLLALAYRDADVRLNHDTTVRFHVAFIELISGAIYVDTGADREHGALPVVVTTALGSFSHVGTQFMVVVDDAQEVRATVREGTIRLLTEDVQKNFSATEDRAEIVKISRSGTIETELAESHGKLWTWVVDTSPGKAIDGLSAHEVLDWIAGEMGLQVKYADAQAILVAEQSLMKAPDGRMDPRQALKLVPRITSLDVEGSNGMELLVSAHGSEGDQHPD